MTLSARTSASPATVALAMVLIGGTAPAPTSGATSRATPVILGRVAGEWSFFKPDTAAPLTYYESRIEVGVRRALSATAVVGGQRIVLRHLTGVLWRGESASSRIFAAMNRPSTPVSIRACNRRGCVALMRTLRTTSPGRSANPQA